MHAKCKHYVCTYAELYVWVNSVVVFLSFEHNNVLYAVRDILINDGEDDDDKQ